MAELLDQSWMGRGPLITVCDRAHEELGQHADLHWSVPDPVLLGTPAAFDRTCEDPTRRVNNLAHHLTAS